MSGATFAAEYPWTHAMVGPDVAHEGSISFAPNTVTWRKFDATHDLTGSTAFVAHKFPPALLTYYAELLVPIPKLRVEEVIEPVHEKYP